MNSYRIAAVAAGIGILWASKDFIRAAIKGIFPQGLPGEKNTALLATACPASSTPSTAKDLENVTEYDYIIVGTGTAGCVLANRLTENPNTKVLAIEAGFSDIKQIMSRIPSGLTKLFKTPADWAFATTPQPGCADREIDWPRGKMIGGCSSINAMIYTRGSPDDYDEWAKLGNKGWAYKDIRNYFVKAEKFTQPQDPRLKLPAEDLAQHGRSGPWNVGYTYSVDISKDFADACAEFGIEKTPDFNTDRGILGGGVMQTFIDTKGQRSSTAVAYLTADVVSRPNLKIASGQTVTRIIFDTSGSQPRAVGIEMAASKTSSIQYLAKARKEVLLCTGAVVTPRLLKVSGIGPLSELKKHGIQIVKDLPGVGENLMDHMAYHRLVFKIPPEESLHYLQDPIKSLPATAEWFRSGTGPLTSQACDAVAYVRTAARDDLPPHLKEVDRASGPNSSDLEIMCFSLCFTENGRFVAPMEHGYCQIAPIGLRPQSKGSITLSSPSVFTPPTINPNILSSPYDLDILLYGIRLSIKIAKSTTLAKYFRGWYRGPHHPLDWDVVSDEDIKTHIRQVSDTLYHPVGTAKMGLREDLTAVVDETLCVHGVAGLRVVDASVFPTMLACHPCAPVVMIAEKAADMIKLAAGV